MQREIQHYDLRMRQHAPERSRLILDRVLFHAWLLLQCRLRVAVGERLERGATDERDRRLPRLIHAQERMARAAWWN